MSMTGYDIDRRNRISRRRCREWTRDGDLLWSEWEVSATTTAGTDYRAGGIAIHCVENGPVDWLPFYLDPVNDEPVTAAGQLAGHDGGAGG